MPLVQRPVEDKVAAYAQYIADSIDATIFLKHSGKPHSPDDVDVFLCDTGWQGRRYAPNFFRADTVF